MPDSRDMLAGIFINAVWDFFKTTCYTMYLGYLGMLVFAAAFLIAVVTGKTSLPVWAGIFNLLPLVVVILPTKPYLHKILKISFGGFKNPLIY